MCAGGSFVSWCRAFDTAARSWAKIALWCLIHRAVLVRRLCILLL